MIGDHVADVNGLMQRPDRNHEPAPFGYEILDEAEKEARRLLTATMADDVATDVSSTLRMIPLEDLSVRAGRVRGRGYVHESDAAWEIVQEVVEPFLANMRRRASLDLLGASAVVATGIVAGLYIVDPPTMAPCWPTPALTSSR